MLRLNRVNSGNQTPPKKILLPNLYTIDEMRNKSVRWQKRISSYYNKCV